MDACIIRARRRRNTTRSFLRHRDRVAEASSWRSRGDPAGNAGRGKGRDAKLSVSRIGHQRSPTRGRIEDTWRRLRIVRSTARPRAGLAASGRQVGDGSAAGKRKSARTPLGQGSGSGIGTRKLFSTPGPRSVIRLLYGRRQRCAVRLCAPGSGLHQLAQQLSARAVAQRPVRAAWACLTHAGISRNRASANSQISGVRAESVHHRGFLRRRFLHTMPRRLTNPSVL